MDAAKIFDSYIFVNVLAETILGKYGEESKASHLSADCDRATPMSIG